MSQHKARKRGQFYATCPLGLNEVLVQEFSQFDVQIESVEKMGLTFNATFEEVLKVILHTRIASKIWWILHQENISDEQQVYEVSRTIPWKDFFTLRETFKVRTVLGKSEQRESSQFKNALYLSLLVKDAIVDHFQAEFGERPSISKEFPMVEVGLHLRPNAEGSENLTLLLDLCGIPLNQRGYRSSRFSAPLRENLAAGIIDLMQWKESEQIFIDSMCGSGVMPIEAAIKKLKITPSYLQIEKMVQRRSCFYHFSRLQVFHRDQSLQRFWHTMLDELQEQNRQKLHDAEKTNGLNILGFDIHEGALVEARDALKCAHLHKLISLKRLDATKLTPPEGNEGIIFCNPPYGERLVVEDLEQLYFQYGENLKKNFKGYSAFILTANLEMRKKIGLRTHQRLTLYNGPLECRLLEYRLY